MNLTRLLATLLGFSTLSSAETVRLYFDPATPQIAFAAGDIKAALEKQKHSVETHGLDALAKDNPGKRIVLAIASNKAIASKLTAHGGKAVAELGAQAYALRTTTAPDVSYWVLGGDANGAMYGGLQIAEHIKFTGFSGTHDNDESPAIRRRGIKLNIPFDKESVTYGKSSIEGINHAILNVWDLSFWTTWLDEMARHRYNVLSLWSNHPFTSMIKLPDYPDVAIQNVTNFDGKKLTLSIDEKIVLWRKVMAHAKARGFDFYLFNWNIWTDGASGKYGITDAKPKAATSPETIAYMRKCMTALLETYPQLDGFGITQGEHVSENDADNSAFLAKTFGLGFADYAKAHPERNLTFIHRWHLADFKEIKANFAELFALPNVKFEMSFKYSLAHMYANPLPQRMSETHTKPLREHQLKSWLTVRNDDFYYHNWGEPAFARAYVNGMINQGDWFTGFYMGSDGYSPTRTFFSKNSATQGLLEVQRQWYMFMLWGRLSYNPATSDSVFKNHMALRYPGVSAEALFAAWNKASSGLPKVGDLITGTLGRDNQWWPEASQSKEAFLTIADFGAAKANKGSKLASIADTATGQVKGKQSAFAVADEIEADALEALALVSAMSAPANTELSAALDNIKAMSHLTLYYASKIRGATFLLGKDSEKARQSVGIGYWRWINYAELMDRMYTGMKMARSLDLANWRAHDASVLKEYTDLGGVGLPEKSVSLDRTAKPSDRPRL